MSFVLRKLDRRAAFHSVDWVGTGDVAGDALCNLRTQGNALSVWLIDDNRANLERIIAAVAAGRMKLDKLDYALIEPGKLDELGIRITREKGASCDDDANALWHQDLRNLSGAKLVELAVLMQTHSEFKRVYKKEVGQLIVARYSFSSRPGPAPGSYDATSPDAGPHQASGAPGASATHSASP